MYSNVRSNDPSPFRSELGARWNSRLYDDPPPSFFDLSARFLDHAGTEVVWAFTDSYVLSQLETRLVFLKGSTARLVPGYSSQCHDNAADNADLYDYRVWTGWALSADGLWRPHSWNSLPDDPSLPQLIETTVPRLVYAGFCLTPVETAHFIAHPDLSHLEASL